MLVLMENAAEELRHSAPGGGWTRHRTVHADSNRLDRTCTELMPPVPSCTATTRAATCTTLRFYLGGQPYTGDPTQIELKAHQEIAIVHGALPTGITPPASFTFDSGE